MRLTQGTQIQKIYKILARIRHVPSLQNHNCKNNLVLSTRMSHVPHSKYHNFKKIVDKDEAYTSPYKLKFKKIQIFNKGEACASPSNYKFKKKCFVNKGEAYASP